MINFNFNKNNILPDNNVTKEDLQRVLDKLYRCRDLEISNLWQRSVFLSVFLILCFSAHGYLIFETFKKDNSTINLLFMGSFLSLLGIIMSIIWISMAKASKAWYEVYEEAITKFEHTYGEVLGIPKDYIMGNMNIVTNELDIDILSRNGGAFSPSRINIIIGQICLIWWVFSEIFYLLYIIKNYVINPKINNYYTDIFIIVIVLTLIYFILNFNNYIKSGFLSKKRK